MLTNQLFLEPFELFAHGSRRTTCNAGNLFKGILLDRAEQKKIPFFGSQFFEQTVNDRLFLFMRSGRCGSQLFFAGFVQALPALAAAETVQAMMIGDSVQPRREGGSFFIASESLIRLNEHFLGRVLRFRLIPEQQAAVYINLFFVGLNDRLVAFAPPGQYLGNYRFDCGLLIGIGFGICRLQVILSFQCPYLCNDPNRFKCDGRGTISTLTA